MGRDLENERAGKFPGGSWRAEVGQKDSEKLQNTHSNRHMCEGSRVCNLLGSQ